MGGKEKVKEHSGREQTWMETSPKCQNVTHFGLDWVARQGEDVV